MMAEKRKTSSTPPKPKPKLTGEAAIQRIANSTVSHVRLPMLDVIFDRSVQLLTESFLHLIATDVRFSLDDIEYGRFGDFISEDPSERMIAVVRAVEWDGSFLIAFDAPTMRALVEILLGGDPEKVKPVEALSRPSTIETRLAGRIMNVIAQRLSEAFSGITPITFEIERIELNRQFAAITRATSAAVSAGIDLDVANLKSRISIIVPHTTLEPVKGALLQMFLGERLGRDDGWTRHFSDALTRTTLTFEAVMHSGSLPLEEVLQWTDGMTISFDTASDADVSLMCDNELFFRGPMGRRGGNIAVKIEDVFVPAVPEETEEIEPTDDDDPDQEEAA